MGRLTARHRTRLIAQADLSFNDTCIISQASSPSQNSYGEVSYSFVDVEDVPCGIEYIASAGAVSFKDELGGAVVLKGDAQLRVKLSQALSVEDFVTVRNKRYSVDGVYDGLTCRFAVLKSLETSEGTD